MYAVIVDAYSTGRFLAKELVRLGYRLIHIQSRQDVPEFFQDGFGAECFSLSLVWNGQLSADKPYEAVSSSTGRDSLSMEAIVSLVQGYSPKFVVAGSELGIVCADKLAALLGLEGNDVATSALRKDKFLMQASLKEAGIHGIDSLQTADVNHAIAFFQQRDAKPVVIKPLSSAGSDGVLICKTPTEIEKAFHLLLGAKNFLGGVNHHLLIQEKIEGTQYIINTVSRQGKHYLCDMWQEQRYQLAGYADLGDKEWLIRDFEDKKVQSLIDYTWRCLDVLGVANGASHAEVFWDNHRQRPVLIEVGARLQGSICYKAVESVLGHSHVSMLIDHYTGKTLQDVRDKHHSEKWCLAVLMICPHDTVIKDDTALSHIKQLPSFVDGLHLPEKGQFVPKTIDLTTCPGMLYLVSESKAKLEKDYVKIRELERQLFA